MSEKDKKEDSKNPYPLKPDGKVRVTKGADTPKYQWKKYALEK